MPVWFRGVALVGWLLIAGCGQGSSQFEIAGDVTFEGKPIENGTITFLDATAADTSQAPRVTGTIASGRYTLLATPGEKIVAIEAYENRPDPAAPLDSYPGSGPPDQRVQIVPERYNVKSELHYTVADPDRAINFDLPP